MVFLCRILCRPVPPQQQHYVKNEDTFKWPNLFSYPPITKTGHGHSSLFQTGLFWVWRAIVPLVSKEIPPTFSPCCVFNRSQSTAEELWQLTSGLKTYRSVSSAVHTASCSDLSRSQQSQQRRALSKHPYLGQCFPKWGSGPSTRLWAMNGGLKRIPRHKKYNSYIISLNNSKSKTTCTCEAINFLS